MKYCFACIFSFKVASSKMVKHEKICSNNQHVFIPFIIDLLCRVEKVMHNNIMSHRSINVVFTIIDFAIQKNLVAQLVTRLPSI